MSRPGMSSNMGKEALDESMHDQIGMGVAWSLAMTESRTSWELDHTSVCCNARLCKYLEELLWVTISQRESGSFLYPFQLYAESWAKESAIVWLLYKPVILQLQRTRAMCLEWSKSSPCGEEKQIWYQNKQTTGKTAWWDNSGHAWNKCFISKCKSKAVNNQVLKNWHEELLSILKRDDNIVRMILDSWTFRSCR